MTIEFGSCGSVDVPCSCFSGDCWNDYFKSCCKCCCCCDTATAVFCCGSNMIDPPCCGGEGGGEGGIVESLKQKFRYPKFKTLEAKVCSLPCEPVLVTLTSTCCIVCGGGGLTHKGEGTVSASAGSGDCTTGVVTINGQNPPYQAGDGEGLTIDLQINPECSDCVCCYQWCAGEETGENPCDGSEDPGEVDCSSGSAPPPAMRQKLYLYRLGKLHLNKKMLTEKLKQLASKVRKKYGLTPRFRPIERKDRPKK